MATDIPLQTIRKSAVKGVLRPGNDIYICRARIQSDTRHIDSFAPIRISTIIAAEFAKHVDRVEHGMVCSDLISETEDMPDLDFEYVIKPVIREWSTSLNNSVGDNNHIKLDIELYRVKNRRLLSSFTIDRESPWHRAGTNFPCDLIIEPLEKIVPLLFT